MSEKQKTEAALYPVLPLRDIVVFPHMIVPLFVGREKSVKALEEVMKTDRPILLVAQKDPTLDAPTEDELYHVGTLGSVLQLLKLPDGTVKVLIEGKQRARIHKFGASEEYFEAMVEPVTEELGAKDEIEALSRTSLSQFEQYTKLNRKIPPESLASVRQIEDPSKLADSIAAHLSLKISDKQTLLEAVKVVERLESVYAFMEAEISVLQVEKRIRSRVKRQMEKTQREYYLNEQMKAIQKELGEGEDGGDEISELEDLLESTKLSKEAYEKGASEIKKLRSMSPMSAEATVVRNYLEWLLNIPWNKRSRVKKDLAVAQSVLDEDHYGLKKVKERIVEYLAVQKRVGKVKGPILCLVGPPGVGKTSLGRSIAKATGRKFARISLGGVRDESEIRGHRRTYIGSMPGKIIQGMKKAENSNPLFLLDEIDKLGSDSRGDPSSALLEVLDPEQNATFMDHYLEVEYDLSDVMFVTTANSLRMQQPLLDRMEIIRISGYTEEEKMEISKRHLLPKQMKNHGIKKGEVALEDDAILDMIRYYTREAGVRSMERELAKALRKALTQLESSSKKKLVISSKNLKEYLGIRRYRYGEIAYEDMVGITTGLAWTEVGGELLSIEAVSVPGKGKMQITGKLGDVMQESVQAAASFVRSRSDSYGIDQSSFQTKDIHVHVPEGATPKDGPSAGVAMCTSIVSILTGIPVRRDIAMTGEISLRGRVMPIGGLKEKLLAAARGGIKVALIPIENEKDLEEIPKSVMKQLKIIPVETVDEVLKNALTKPLTPLGPLKKTDEGSQKTAISKDLVAKKAKSGDPAVQDAIN